MRRLFDALAVACVLTFAGCSAPVDDSPKTPTTPTPPPTPAITAITIVSSLIAPKPGDTAQFHAMATLANGTSQTVTMQATWETSDPNVVSVTKSGLVTAVAEGDADVRASYQNVTGSLRLKVVVPPPGPTTFTVSGTIREAGTNAAIPAATVTAKNAPVFALSDPFGRYRITGLKEGTLALRVTKFGYEAAEVTVAVSGDVSADITMKKSVTAGGS